MIKDGFDNRFELDDYNKANSALQLNINDSLYDTFFKYIQDEEKMNKVLEANDNGISPVSLFIQDNYDILEAEINNLSKNQKKIATFKKTLRQLWNFLFLTVNKAQYSGNIMIKNSSRKGILQHVPVYSPSNTKKIRTLIEVSLFATRSFACLRNYKKVVDDLAAISEPFPDDSNVYSSLDTYFISHFFNLSESSLDREIIHYNGQNKNKCKKSDESMFLLSKNMSSSNNSNKNNIFDKNSLLDGLEKKLVEYAKMALEFKRKSPNIFNDSDFDYNEILKENNSTRGKHATYYARRFKNDFNRARFKITNYYKEGELKSVATSDFDELGHKLSEINNLYDIYQIINSDKYRVIIYASKLGIINIVLVDYFSFKSSWENDNYDEKNTNKLVHQAYKDSLLIENRHHELTKLFNIINLNAIIKPGKNENSKHVVLGLPYDNNNTNDLSKLLYKTNNTSKAIYVRLTYNHKDILRDDESYMIYYDYLSILVAYSHSYDKQTLWEYINSKIPIYEEYKDKIHDMASSRTSHFYYDDSLFTYTIMDQSPRFAKFNDLIGENKPYDYKNLQSHEHRLYSLWEFSSICDALIYGSSSMLIYSLLNKYVAKESNRTSKITILLSQHRLSKIYSSVNIKANHLVFNPKGRNFELISNVFKKMGMIDAEEKAEDIFNANWEYANINNSRFYQRIGLYISLVSFLISLAAFAWTSAIFIDFDCRLRNGYSWDELLLAFKETQKFHFVLVIAAIPLTIFLVLTLIEYCTKRSIARNLARYLLKHS